MTQLGSILIILVCICILLYMVLATCTNWIPCVTSDEFKCKCVSAYKYGTNMVTPWKQIIEVSGTWIPDEYYTIVRKKYLFGTVKYQVVTPYEDV